MAARGGALDLACCHGCLAEQHLSGGAYLDHEAALPLVFCHRHRTWRQDHCRRCRPRKAPHFVHDHAVEFVCGDCGVPLRLRHWTRPIPAIDIEPGEAATALPILFSFDGQLRNALLGGCADLPEVGRVTAKQFLAVLCDLNRALLAPNLTGTSLINYFDCPLLPKMRDHAPQTWDEQPYQELSPFERTRVLSAVVALLAGEPVSHIISGSQSRFREHQTLEWL